MGRDITSRAGRLAVISTSLPSLACAFGDPGLPDRIFLEGQFSGAHVSWRILRGTHVTDEQSLFQEFATALQFPKYFGGNWDALDECIHDLSWLRGDGVVMVLDSFLESSLVRAFVDRIVRIISDDRIDAEDDGSNGPRRLIAVACEPSGSEEYVRAELEGRGISLGRQLRLADYIASLLS